MVFASMRVECLFLRARAFDKQLQKFCEHPSNFCEQFEQRPNFASTFKFNETILDPCFYWLKQISMKIPDQVISVSSLSTLIIIFFSSFFLNFFLNLSVFMTMNIFLIISDCSLVAQTNA